MRRTAVLAFTVLLGTMAYAQKPAATTAPTNENMLFTAAQLQEILQKGPVKDGKPGSFSTRLFNASTFSCAFIRLSDPDKPHAHGKWSEVFVITEGAGTLVTGGKMLGPFTSNSAVHKEIFVNQEGQATPPAAASTDRVMNEAPPPGADASGSSIEGGRVQQVKAGDVVLVPAGVAHTWTKIDQPVVYLDIKFPKAE